MQINTITTERLLLRRMQPADAPALFSFWSDPNVSKHMNIESMTRIKQAEDMIFLINKLCAEDQAIRWSIVLQESGEMVGSCGFNSFDFEHGRTEIGYDLGSPYWGKGYATEAVRAVIGYGFSELGLNRVEAKVEPDNRGSIRVLSKLRFVEEGLLRQYEKSNGQFVDLLIFSLLRDEWTEPSGN
ncbi:GNAT family protein [Brevibacillus agri]|uniref:GNAT family N-acetyltransferase n=1 Tax=Brevibacillus agri TaxID=51101 RepID=UPI0028704302|nr:GNAT family protein [Brevibacillus agri]MDR9505191.1 GNAT family protein [Brevibacillus agri]MED1826097.1 GNAT family protein [Brevibacillus agri]